MLALGAHLLGFPQELSFSPAHFKPQSFGSVGLWMRISKDFLSYGGSTVGSCVGSKLSERSQNGAAVAILKGGRRESEVRCQRSPHCAGKQP